MVDGKATQALFIDGKKTNRQADLDSPVAQGLADDIRSALARHSIFQSYARPHRWAKIRFARYGVGDAYDMHVDHPVMTAADGMMRSDLSFTVFLSDPSEYEGGELMMQGTSTQQAVKLPRGSAVIYATTVPHRVTPVTSGERWVGVGWVQSLVRREDQREVLFDLSRLRPALPAGPARLTLEKSIFNLIRLWADA
jgi:PKHD-type hydroxylase